jgi:hypothetical protein
MTAIYMEPGSVRHAGSTALRVGAEAGGHGAWLGSRATGGGVLMPPHLAARVAQVCGAGAARAAGAGAVMGGVGTELHARAGLMDAIQRGTATAANVTGTIDRFFANPATRAERVRKWLAMRRSALDRAFGARSIGNNLQRAKKDIETFSRRAQRAVELRARDTANRLTHGVASKIARNPQVAKVSKFFNKVAKPLAIAATAAEVADDLSRGRWKAATSKVVAVAATKNPVAFGVDVATGGLLSTSIRMGGDALEGEPTDLKAKRGDYGKPAQFMMNLCDKPSHLFGQLVGLE